MQKAILTTNHLVDNDSDRRAHNINDPHASRRTSKKNASQVAEIHDVIDYLDVEEAERYLPGAGKTYCNIYAHDYAYLCGAYIPRVWWDKDALIDIAAGKNVEEHYGKTVYELNANAIYDWFTSYGSDFNWKQATDAMALQKRADTGSVCVIVARRKNRKRSGHIAAVVPQSSGYSSSSWPVESQAGSINYQYHIKQNAWWEKVKFDAHAFWHHD